MRKTTMAAAVGVVVLSLGAAPALARTGDHAGDWEVALGRRHTKAGAEKLTAKVEAKDAALKPALEADGRGDWEVEIDGFTKKAAQAERDRIRRRDRLHASVERS